MFTLQKISMQTWPTARSRFCQSALWDGLPLAEVQSAWICGHDVIIKRRENFYTEKKGHKPRTC